MENQKFGTSQFAEQVNYQRALEGELARSIQSISAVESARVHLALPKPSLFVRDQQKPTRLGGAEAAPRPQRSTTAQVSAIVHLVSSSVPELVAEERHAWSTRTATCSPAANAGRPRPGRQPAQVRAGDRAGYVRRIEAILQPLVGAGNVRAQVAAEIDFSIVERDRREIQAPTRNPAAAPCAASRPANRCSRPAWQPAGVPGRAVQPAAGHAHRAGRVASRRADAAPRASCK